MRRSRPHPQACPRQRTLPSRARRPSGTRSRVPTPSPTRTAIHRHPLRISGLDRQVPMGPTPRSREPRGRRASRPPQISASILSSR
jgi:hypothetical protein